MRFGRDTRPKLEHVTGLTTRANGDYVLADCGNSLAIIRYVLRLDIAQRVGLDFLSPVLSAASHRFLWDCEILEDGEWRAHYMEASTRVTQICGHDEKFRWWGRAGL